VPCHANTQVYYGRYLHRHDMIFLASFPRSGNTLFRNVLLDVYGISSLAYHPNKKKFDFDACLVVKTHVLPQVLPRDVRSRPAVYLVRDGRDAMVSMAHSRKDITAPGSNYYLNLAAAVLSLNDRQVGGWSRNVKAWTDRVSIVIRYEDLIEDPIREVEKLRALIDLPEPDRAKLPTFESLREGTHKYGSGHKRDDTEEKKKIYANKFFRRGVAGAYKDEMPRIFQWLFWLLNRKQMRAQNYYRDSAQSAK
jgi:hypothetical protein